MYLYVLPKAVYRLSPRPGFHTLIFSYDNLTVTPSFYPSYHMPRHTNLCASLVHLERIPSLLPLQD